ncbi:MAG: Fe-S protein assembly co-chaperone HscB [Burkholderiaceae bacterium]
MNPLMSEFAQASKLQLNSDSFQIFDLPRVFDLDEARLTERFHQLMHAVHPDRHAGATEVERRQAMQWSSRINEAYRQLLKPLARAQLLCEIFAGPLDVLRTAMPPAFLMRQMQWREDFEAISLDANRLDQVDALEAEVKLEGKQITSQFAQTSIALGQSPSADDAKLAADLLRQWMFVEKFLDDIEQQRMQWLEVLPS